MRLSLVLRLLGGAALLAIAVAILWGAIHPRIDTGSVSGIRPAEPSSAQAGSAKGAAASSVSPVNFREAIEGLLAKLRRGEAKPEDLEALRRLLLGGDPRQAMAAILDFLRGGKDAATGQEFALGSGGALAGAPTFRVFLMDLLGQLAKTTGSGAADAYARTVLEQKTSPEEWAISLRNVGWSEPGATAFLGSKMREMLAETSWTATPSAALLEAFDVIVYTGDPTFVGQLADISQTGASSMQRAALVALDRLSETAPLSVMEYLNANPDVIADHPLRRADYFSKADLVQPAQEAALETYLDRADVGLPEKTKLLDELAAPASFISDSLLTSPPAPDDGTAHQRAYSALLNQWLASDRFPALVPAIRNVQGRLSGP